MTTEIFLPSKQGFVLRLNYPGSRPPSTYPPTRTYIHETAVDSLSQSVGTKDSRLREVLERTAKVASGHLIHSLEASSDRLGSDFQCFDYLLAFLWAEQEARMVDFWGCVVDPNQEKWKGNAVEYHPWFTRNGQILAVGEGAFCGEGISISNQEEEYRRTCKDLAEYLKNPPQIR
jgi:hypothetical protein